ncbi:MAG: response regulator transcription factor [Chloroflexota bacterium]
MIRVILAEDHALVRAGIRALLEKAEDMNVLGEAADGQEVIELAEKMTPDVVVMDIMMPRLNGIQAAEKMHLLKIPARVVLLSMYSDEALVYQAIQNGVKGYVLKTSLGDELVLAVRAAARGETYLSTPVSEIVAQKKSSVSNLIEEKSPFSMLSPREKEILKLIGEEYTSAEVAELLFISEKTVEKHRSSLMGKLQVRNLAGLVRVAIKYGLVNLDGVHANKLVES